ncbi:hypothetical protein, partial [Hafnia paralvei]|uniref:hypothetical protein n=2 Tax=Hafnia paralvei TaxID=546367 RepID=UPI00300C0328
MPNSEVKRRSADGSVGSPHARVGNCQALNKRKSLMRKHGAFLFICCLSNPSRTDFAIGVLNNFDCFTNDSICS